MNEKFCLRCSRRMAASFFSVDTSHPSGLADVCQSCQEDIDSMIRLIGNNQRKPKEGVS